ncbi:intracellular protein transport protein USO1-like [Ctenocephalides felis]|uniref:intracellular protein transport protein USO1-like n=1 Tax=Ctenocephalides felis TaxID=7515 RepID=UPI000E6E22D8|nr:intracellular protein transport protein USO1-like [Ctenocephalides felis]
MCGERKSSGHYVNDVIEKLNGSIKINAYEDHNLTLSNIHIPDDRELSINKTTKPLVSLYKNSSKSNPNPINYDDATVIMLPVRDDTQSKINNCSEFSNTNAPIDATTDSDTTSEEYEHLDFELIKISHRDENKHVENINKNLGDSDEIHIKDTEAAEQIDVNDMSFKINQNKDDQNSKTMEVDTENQTNEKEKNGAVKICTSEKELNHDSQKDNEIQIKTPQEQIDVNDMPFKINQNKDDQDSKTMEVDTENQTNEQEKNGAVKICTSEKEVNHDFQKDNEIQIKTLQEQIDVNDMPFKINQNKDDQDSKTMEIDTENQTNEKEKNGAVKICMSEKKVNHDSQKGDEIQIKTPQEQIDVNDMSFKINQNEDDQDSKTMEVDTENQTNEKEKNGVVKICTSENEVNHDSQKDANLDKTPILGILIKTQEKQIDVNDIPFKINQNQDDQDSKTMKVDTENQTNEKKKMALLKFVREQIDVSEMPFKINQNKDDQDSKTMEVDTENQTNEQEKNGAVKICTSEKEVNHDFQKDNEIQIKTLQEQIDVNDMPFKINQNKDDQDSKTMEIDTENQTNEKEKNGAVKICMSEKKVNHDSQKGDEIQIKTPQEQIDVNDMSFEINQNEDDQDSKTMEVDTENQTNEKEKNGVVKICTSENEVKQMLDKTPILGILIKTQQKQIDVNDIPFKINQNQDDQDSKTMENNEIQIKTPQEQIDVNDMPFKINQNKDDQDSKTMEADTENQTNEQEKNGAVKICTSENEVNHDSRKDANLDKTPIMGILIKTQQKQIDVNDIPIKINQNQDDQDSKTMEVDTENQTNEKEKNSAVKICTSEKEINHDFQKDNEIQIKTPQEQIDVSDIPFKINQNKDDQDSKTMEIDTENQTNEKEKNGAVKICTSEKEEQIDVNNNENEVNHDSRKDANLDKTPIMGILIKTHQKQIHVNDIPFKINQNKDDQDSKTIETDTENQTNEKEKNSAVKICTSKNEVNHDSRNDANLDKGPIMGILIKTQQKQIDVNDIPFKINQNQDDQDSKSMEADTENQTNEQEKNGAVKICTSEKEVNHDSQKDNEIQIKTPQEQIDVKRYAF